MPLAPGSLEEFITEHYWGYNQWDAKKTLEYAVEHIPWSCYPVQSHHVGIHFEDIYPASFSPCLYQEPHSVLLAEGSEIVVRKGMLL